MSEEEGRRDSELWDRLRTTIFFDSPFEERFVGHDGEPDPNDILDTTANDGVGAPVELVVSAQPGAACACMADAEQAVDAVAGPGFCGLARVRPAGDTDGGGG